MFLVLKVGCLLQIASVCTATPFQYNMLKICICEGLAHYCLAAVVAVHSRASWPHPRPANACLAAVVTVHSRANWAQPRPAKTCLAAVVAGHSSATWAQPGPAKACLAAKSEDC